MRKYRQELRVNIIRFLIALEYNLQNRTSSLTKK